MRTIFFSVAVGVFIMLSACASQIPQSEKTTAPDVAKIEDIPAGPPGMFDGEISMAVASASTPKPESEPADGFIGIIQRMEVNPFTQYSRERNQYSFYVGAELEAQLQPGKALILREDSSQPGLVCKYHLDGKLDIANISFEELKSRQKACANLMFTFDKQLNEE
ncbi:MAG: hypothetical protein OEZ43_18660 [Gammaproteobacteria bacterium]|nr:hypothetical protein [Gammaproteobacteria bacterium]